MFFCLLMQGILATTRSKPFFVLFFVYDIDFVSSFSCLRYKAMTFLLAHAYLFLSTQHKFLLHIYIVLNCLNCCELGVRHLNLLLLYIILLRLKVS